MTVEDFFARYVEGYLFGDLKSMANISSDPSTGHGGVGYPMVATTLAGMELLGELLMPNVDHFDPNNGNVYFHNYWDNYFSRQYSEYTGLGRLFRQLVRNGIAHTFVAKPGIFVEKGTNRQMSVDTTRQEIYIDCNVFFREFEDSYTKSVLPILNDSAVAATTTKSNIQTRLDDLSAIYSNDSARLFGSIPAPHPSTNNTRRREQVPVSPLFSQIGVFTSGASLPLGGPSGMNATSFSTTTSGAGHNITSSVTLPPNINQSSEE